MDTFTDLCNKHRTDKGTNLGESHGYSSLYEELFSPIRNEQLNILEIGIADSRNPGASLNVLSEYFPNSTIFGADIEDCSRFQIPRTQTFIVDTGRSDTLDVLVKHGPYNIIIDDGSHLHEHHIICFNKLFNKLHPNSMYIIEDLHPACSQPTVTYFSNMDDQTKNSIGIKSLSFHYNNKLLVIHN